MVVEFVETTRLVRSAQSGNSRDRETLFARYLPRVSQIVALRMGRKLVEILEYDDLVQEALLEAVARFDSFEIRSEGSFRNWLAQIAENKIRGAARSAGALKRGGGVRREGDVYDSQVLSRSILPGRDPSPVDAAAGSELERRLERALLDLPQHDRQVIELRRVVGLEFEEIAKEIGVGSASSARSRFSRALNKLSQTFPTE